MKLIEILTPEGDKLKMVPGSPAIKGTDKYVYKMTDGVHIVAAKIFKTNREIQQEEGGWVGIITTRPYRIYDEYIGYKQLINTALRPYLPTFYYPLFNRRGWVTGLAFSWHNGISLDSLPSDILTSQEIDTFQEDVLSTIAEGIVPDLDSISTNNIFFDPNRSPRLWLAEYGLETEDFHVERGFYLRAFNNTLDDLRRQSI